MSERRRSDVENGHNTNTDSDGDTETPPDLSNIRVLHPIAEAGMGKAPETDTSGLRQRMPEREHTDETAVESQADSQADPQAEPQSGSANEEETQRARAAQSSGLPDRSAPGHITFSPETYNRPTRGRALRIPGPREFEKGVDLPPTIGIYLFCCKFC